MRVLNLYDPDTRQTIVAEFVANSASPDQVRNARSQVFFFIRDILSLLAAFTLALRLIDGSINIIQQGQSIVGLLGIGGTVAVIAGFILAQRSLQFAERAMQSKAPQRQPNRRSAETTKANALARNLIAPSNLNQPIHPIKRRRR